MKHNALSVAALRKAVVAFLRNPGDDSAWWAIWNAMFIIRQEFNRRQVHQAMAAEGRKSDAPEDTRDGSVKTEDT